jgi:hypothetical protein
MLLAGLHDRVRLQPRGTLQRPVVSCVGHLI